MIPIHGSTLRVGLIGIFLLPVLAIIPSAQAEIQADVELFTGYDLGTYPPVPVANRPSGWTYGQVGTTVNEIDLTPAISLGSQALHSGSTIDTCPSSCVAPAIAFGADMECDGESEYIEFSIYLDAIPVSNTVVVAFDTDDTSQWELRFTESSVVDMRLVSSTGATQILGHRNYVEDQWYTFRASGFNCAGEDFGVTSYETGDLSTFVATNLLGGLAGSMDAPDGMHVELGGGSVGDSNPNTYYDNITFQADIQAAGVRFCANQLEHDAAGHASSDNPNYGYTYRRGGGFFDQAEGDEFGIGLSTGYSFEGSSSESSWDYSAKQFTTGSEAMHAVVTIEAATEGASSVFRVSFNTVAGATPSSTTKGDGLTTGNFANHAEAQFTENGDRWQIALYYVTGGGSRTQLGPAVNHGSANDARTYSVWSDNRGTTPWIAVKDANGATVITSNSTAPGTLATFQTAFAGDEIFDIWYIGYGTGVFPGEATTALDNNEAAAGNSTCMYDDVGTAVTAGSSGTLPADVVPPDVDPDPSEDCEALFCPPEEGIGGLSSEALSLFLGIVLVASFAASMNEKTGAGAAGLAIFALLGVFIAFSLGYIQLWVVLILFAIGLGGIFLGLLNHGRSEAM